MAKQERPQKGGFVIKLSNATVEKLNKEDDESKQDELSKSEVKPVISSDQVNNIQTQIDKQPNITNTDKEYLKEDLSNIKEIDEDEIKKSHSSWGEYAAYVTYEGEDAIYTDPSSQQKYLWNKLNNAWDPKGDPSETPDRVYTFENDTHIYTDPDGSKFFWDLEKKAWLPKVDDDFLAMYQMSYGFIDNTSKEQKDTSDEKVKPKQTKDNAQSSAKRKTEPQWFEPSNEKNTKVYVSNLPHDVTEEEFVELMQKCGLVEQDPRTRKMKIKLYMDKQQDCFKGDALCTYIKIESVDLALKLLDGSDFKGNKIKVERAQFQMKGEYDPGLKPKKKKKKELEKLKKMQEKLFDWRPEKFIGERSKHERVVIVKNLFHPSDFDNEVQLILDYQQDLREECSKSGEVRKVVIYDRHPEGVAQITMKEPEQADAVIQLINGRWFGKRQITAEIWDGRTKYRIAETDADINKRIDKWDKFLEGKDDINKDPSKKVTIDTSEEIKESVKENNTTNIKESTDEVTTLTSVNVTN